MKPFIYHAASNEIREKAADMPDDYYTQQFTNSIQRKKDYDAHLASLQHFTCHPSCKEVWKDGEEVTGKFELKELCLIGCTDRCSEYSENNHCDNISQTAYPLTQQESEEEFVNKHLNIIWQKTKDAQIDTVIGKMFGSLEAASISHFLQTGKINGSFRTRLNELMDAVKNWSK